MPESSPEAIEPSGGSLRDRFQRQGSLRDRLQRYSLVTASLNLHPAEEKERAVEEQKQESGLHTPSPSSLQKRVQQYSLLVATTDTTPLVASPKSTSIPILPAISKQEDEYGYTFSRPKFSAVTGAILPPDVSKEDDHTADDDDAFSQSTTSHTGSRGVVVGTTTKVFPKTVLGVKERKKNWTALSSGGTTTTTTTTKTPSNLTDKINQYVDVATQQFVASPKTQPSPTISIATECEGSTSEKIIDDKPPSSLEADESVGSLEQTITVTVAQPLISEEKDGEEQGEREAAQLVSTKDEVEEKEEEQVTEVPVKKDAIESIPVVIVQEDAMTENDQFIETPAKDETAEEQEQVEDALKESLDENIKDEVAADVVAEGTEETKTEAKAAEDNGGASEATDVAFIDKQESSSVPEDDEGEVTELERDEDSSAVDEPPPTKPLLAAVPKERKSGEKLDAAKTEEARVDTTVGTDSREGVIDGAGSRNVVKSSEKKKTKKKKSEKKKKKETSDEGDKPPKTVKKKKKKKKASGEDAQATPKSPRKKKTKEEKRKKVSVTNDL